MGRTGIRNLGGVGTLGGNIQRDIGVQRGVVPGRGAGAGTGLLHPGVSQQNNAPIPSQDLLAIMSRSNPRGPVAQSGLFNLGQVPGVGQVGVSGAPGGGMLQGAPIGFLAQQQQQRAAGLGSVNFGGMDQSQRAPGHIGEPPKFDVNEFPSLGGSVGPRPPAGGQQALRPQIPTVDGQTSAMFEQRKPGQGDLGGFSIHKEDFPALPRAVESGAPGSVDDRVIGQRGQNQAPQGLPLGRMPLRGSSQPVPNVVDQLRSSDLSRSQAPSVAPGAVNPYFQPSHNMPSSVHDSLRTIQQGQMQLRVAAARGIMPGRASALSGITLGNGQVFIVLPYLVKS